MAEDDATGVATGLAAIPRVPWGTHVCHFYRTQRDLDAVLVPFMAAGLAGGERCLWVTAGPFEKDEAHAALARAAPDLAARERAGQIEILGYTDWYLRSAGRVGRGVVDQWVDALAEAEAAGFTGLRLTGNTSFVTHDAFAEFARYEGEVDAAFRRGRFLALCSYHLPACTPDELLEVMRHHGMALVGGDGGARVVHNATQLLAELDRRPEAPGAADAHALRRLALSERDARTRAEAATERIARLQWVTSSLSRSTGLEAIAEAVRTAVAGAMNASHAWLRVDDGAEPGEAVFAPEGLSARAAWPDLPADVRALAVLPLRAGDRALGRLAAAFPTPQPFDLVQRAFLEDVAHQVGLAVERAHLYEEARRERERAERANREKDACLAMVVHELRSPLAPIRTAVDLMRLEGSHAFAREREVIGRQVTQLARLLDDLADVSRFSHGKVALRCEPIRVAGVLADVAETTRPLLEARDVSLGLHVTPEEAAVVADAGRLRQVFVNLVRNAALHSPAGARIAVSARLAAGWLEASVLDQGDGMDQALAARVFEPFVQGARARGGEGGLGLGLTIVRSLVELHGGAVSLHSDGPGQGTEVRLRLPAEGPAAAAPEPGAGRDVSRATPRAPARPTG